MSAAGPDSVARLKAGSARISCAALVAFCFEAYEHVLSLHMQGGVSHVPAGQGDERSSRLMFSLVMTHLYRRNISGLAGL